MNNKTDNKNLKGSLKVQICLVRSDKQHKSFYSSAVITIQKLGTQKKRKCEPNIITTKYVLNCNFVNTKY